MKKILVIHPDDRSTDFLKPIYANLDATVITGGATQHEIRSSIKESDQVFMLGHGSPHGLMPVGQFPLAWHNVINDDHADLLAEKDNSVFIWCNADEFVNYNELKGFHTGMFISEVGEARIMGLNKPTYTDVLESNTWFVDAMSRVAHDDVDDLHSYVKHDYGDLIHRNEVAKYNHERLYLAA